MEHQRAVTLLLVVAGILAGVLVRSAFLAFGAYAAFPDPLLAGLIPTSSILALTTGFATFGILLRMGKVTGFIDSVVAEMYRITWPTREETANNTMIVVGTTLFFASLLAVYDLTWAEITGLFLFTGK